LKSKKIGYYHQGGINTQTDSQRPGIHFVLPETDLTKTVSTIEVGPFIEHTLATELNNKFNAGIYYLFRTNQYILIHDSNIKNLDLLTTGKPFVDPIVHQATLNEPLVKKLGLPFNHVLQSMYNPGTSDMEGDTAFHQAMLKLGLSTQGEGFLSKQYFLNGVFTNDTLEEVSAFLANPDLNKRQKLDSEQYFQGLTIPAPVVNLNLDAKVEEIDVLNMTIDELMELNDTRCLAGNMEEMLQFQNLYKDKDFIEKRKKYGLTDKATDVELKTCFGLRSEHCFHKEFNARVTIEDKVNDPMFEKAFKRGVIEKDENGNYLIEKGIFKTFIEEPAQKVYDKLEKRGKNWIASMFHDDSGVVYYNEDYMFCIKMETHNSPSNKEPVQGAKTGIDGVNRDIFGTGRGTFDALANFFYYATGNPNYAGWLPPGVKTPYTLLKGITQGVREGGNEMQIPTLGGGLVTDPRYIAKILVFAETVGWSPVNDPNGKPYLETHEKVGDHVWVIGQPVGVDGIDGATESSLNASENISLGHVQADFSYIQAKMKGLYQEIARANLSTKAGDFGAMGLGSATHEMARGPGGLFLDLALHPVKYKGIQPWQINCSETQDRMALASRPEHYDEIKKKAKQHDVLATKLGEFTDSGYIHLNHGDKTVCLLDIEKLFNKEPRKEMHGVWDNPKEFISEDHDKLNNYSTKETLLSVMSHPDIASKEWFFRQKDSSVKGATIQGPLLGLKQEVESDVTMQKPLDTEGKDFGAIAYSQGIAPKISDIDAYYSAQSSYMDMVGKIIAFGGTLPDMDEAKWDSWAVCGNYCQPNSDSSATLTKELGEHNLASLVREAMAVEDAIDNLDIPVISGKDSMKCSATYEVPYEFKLTDLPVELQKHATLKTKQKKGVHEDGTKYTGTAKYIELHDPDTYLASSAVKIDDYRKTVNQQFKHAEDLIYVLGNTQAELGASHLYEAMGEKINGTPIEGGKAPKMNFEEFKEVAGQYKKAIQEEIIASGAYIHKGGLAAAVTKGAIAGELGASIDVMKMPSHETKITENELLYSKTPGRFVVTISPKDKQQFEKIMKDVPKSYIGTVEANNISIMNFKGDTEVIDMKEIKTAYQTPLSFGLQEMKK